MQNKGLFSVLDFHGSGPALPLNPLPSKTDGEGNLAQGGETWVLILASYHDPSQSLVFYSGKWG